MSVNNPNPPRRALWEGPIKRSFDQPDVGKRIDDLLALTEPVDLDGVVRYIIHPAEDERVLRVVRKIIRGLAQYHRLLPFVPDSRVWTDVQRYKIPEGLVHAMTYHHREPDVAEYWYELGDGIKLHSAWLLRFFEAAAFVGVIYP